MLICRYFTNYGLSQKVTQTHAIKTRSLFNIDPAQVLGGRSKEYSETKVLG